MAELTHLDDEGRARMVDVGDKDVTRREATAHAQLVTTDVGLASLASLFHFSNWRFIAPTWLEKMKDLSQTMVD